MNQALTAFLDLRAHLDRRAMLDEWDLQETPVLPGKMLWLATVTFSKVKKELQENEENLGDRVLRDL